MKLLKLTKQRTHMAECIIERRRRDNADAQYQKDLTERRRQDQKELNHERKDQRCRSIVDAKDSHYGSVMSNRSLDN